MANICARLSCPIWRYRMQPGDGTNYEFGFMLYDYAYSITTWDLVADTTGGRRLVNETSSDHFGSITEEGIGRTGKGYVHIFIHMVPSVGYCDVDRHTARHPEQLCYYMSRTMPHVNPYTVAAVALAVAVLIEDPANVSFAAKEMLSAPRLLQKME